MVLLVGREPGDLVLIELVSYVGLYTGVLCVRLALDVRQVEYVVPHVMLLLEIENVRNCFVFFRTMEGETNDWRVKGERKLDYLDVVLKSLVAVRVLLDRLGVVAADEAVVLEIFLVVLQLLSQLSEHIDDDT